MGRPPDIVLTVDEVAILLKLAATLDPDDVETREAAVVIEKAHVLKRRGPGAVFGIKRR